MKQNFLQNISYEVAITPNLPPRKGLELMSYSTGVSRSDQRATYLVAFAFVLYICTKCRFFLEAVSPGPEPLSGDEDVFRWYDVSIYF
jgi:hypothetical protein